MTVFIRSRSLPALRATEKWPGKHVTCLITYSVILPKSNREVFPKVNLDLLQTRILVHIVAILQR